MLFNELIFEILPTNSTIRSDKHCNQTKMKRFFMSMLQKLEKRETNIISIDSSDKMILWSVQIVLTLIFYLAVLNTILNRMTT